MVYYMAVCPCQTLVLGYRSCIQLSDSLRGLEEVVEISGLDEL